MSKDLQFWFWRIGVAAAIVVDAYIFNRVVREVVNDTPSKELWILALFAAAVVSLGIGFMYTLAKRRRWSGLGNDYSDIETLQAYMKQQQADQKSPPKQDKSE